MAERAAAGLATTSGEGQAVSWLGRRGCHLAPGAVLGEDHEHGGALRLAIALAPWWDLRGRSVGEDESLMIEMAARAATGSREWCAAQFWLGHIAMLAGDLAGSVRHNTCLRDALAGRPPCRELADGLGGRAIALANIGDLQEAAADGVRSLKVARQVGLPGR